MKKIYVINGRPESGKTFFGKVVGEELERLKISFLHTSSIDPIKMALLPETSWDSTITDNWFLRYHVRLFKKEIVGDKNWDGVTKDNYWRKAMSELKAKITELNPFLIHGMVLGKIKKLPEPYVSFVDIREPENILSFCKYCHEADHSIETAKVLLRSDAGKEFLNISDQSVDDLDYDVIVDNDRQSFRDLSLAGWGFRIKAATFVDQEVLGHRAKERFY